MHNHWIAICFQPSKTIKEVITKKTTYRLFWLCFFYGLATLITFYSSPTIPKFFPTKAIPFLIILVLSTIVGYVLAEINAFVMWITGKLFKGVATFTQLRAAILWSEVPYYLTIPLTLIFQIGLGIGAKPWVLFQIFGVIVFLCALWSFILYLCTVTTVQNYSTRWKALGNMILASIILLIGLGLPYIFYVYKAAQ